MVEYGTAVGGLRDSVLADLEKPLAPEMVKTNTFNRKKPEFEYMTYTDAVRQANRIFGPDGWGMEVIGDVTLDSAQGGSQQFYKAKVRVTVIGAPARDGVGSCQVPTDNASAHDTAMKGAVADAFKKVMKTYGDQFGLGLQSRPQQGGQRQQYSGQRTGGHAYPTTSRSDYPQPGHPAGPPPPHHQQRAGQPVRNDYQQRGRQPGQQHQRRGQETGRPARLDLKEVKDRLEAQNISIDDARNMMGIRTFGVREVQDYMKSRGLSSAEALAAQLGDMANAQRSGAAAV